MCVSRLPPVSFYRYFTGLAISHHQTALDRVSGVVCGDACVPGFGCGLARESVGGVGFEVLVSVSCVSRLPVQRLTAHRVASRPAVQRHRGEPGRTRETHGLTGKQASKLVTSSQVTT